MLDIIVAKEKKSAKGRLQIVITIVHVCTNKTCLPAVGTLVGEVDTAGVVQGLFGLALNGRTLQLPTVNCTSSIAISPR